MQLRRVSGLTLIEVMAALAITAMAAGLMLKAHSRSLTQLRVTQYQTRAAQLAQELMATWTLADVKLTQASTGEAAQDPKWSWRRVVSPYEPMAHPTLTQLELVIYHRNQEGHKQAVTTLTWLERMDAR